MVTTVKNAPTTSAEIAYRKNWMSCSVDVSAVEAGRCAERLGERQRSHPRGAVHGRQVGPGAVVAHGDRADLLVGVLGHGLTGADTRADLLPGGQVHVADVDVAERVLAADEAHDLELGPDLVDGDGVTDGHALVEQGVGEHDLAGAGEGAAGLGLGREPRVTLDAEHGEVEVEPAVGARVHQRQPERAGVGDAVGGAPRLGGVDVDDRACERRRLVHVLLEGERGHGQLLQTGDAVVDETDRQPRQEHHQHTDQRHDRAHQGETSTGERELTQCEEHGYPPTLVDTMSARVGTHCRGCRHDVGTCDQRDARSRPTRLRPTSTPPTPTCGRSGPHRRGC
ncbi:MAG: hypothetical protein NVV70_12980 [Cellulomonas sp.]|nr:hypothetical protein [Cellulomonas sp.]MCR6648995.1 hypothetical protein [Cellulomonas sp.]